MNTLERVELLINKENLNKLKNACVMVVGVGGVGSYAIEALARSGIGKLIIVDKDKVAPSNLNRQIHATFETIGQIKTEVMKKRIQSYNLECEVIEYPQFYSKDLNSELFSHSIDFVIDAIDTISPKFALIQTCLARKIPFISVMGMANRLDASLIRSGYLHETTYCPVAKNIRKLVKKHNIKRKVPVIYSLEHPITQSMELNDSQIRKDRMPPASLAMGPAVAGMMASSKAIISIIKKEEK